MHSTILKAAAVLALICGLMELYLAFTFVPEARRGGGPNAALVRIMTYVLPFLILAGAAGLYFGRIIEGAGGVLVGMSLQHVLLDLTGRNVLAVFVGLAAVLLAMHVQQRRDREANATAREAAGAAPPPLR